MYVLFQLAKMSVLESLGNVIIKPLKEYTVHRPSSKSQEELEALALWENLFKTIATVETLKKSNKFFETIGVCIDDHTSQVPIVYGIKPNFSLRKSEVENSCLTVKRSSTFNFDILFNCQWKKFDTIKLVFTTEQNLQKDAIVEEFTLTSIGDNLIEIIPQAKTTSWFVYVIKALSHKIVLSVSAPNNSAVIGKWNMVLSLSSAQSYDIHNFVLCNIEVVDIEVMLI